MPRPVERLSAVDDAQQRLLLGGFGQQPEHRERDEEAIGRRAVDQAEGRVQRVALRPRKVREPIEHRGADLVERGERELHLRLDASQAEVFDAVAREASQVIGRESTALLRYDPDGTPTAVAVRGGLPGQLGQRVPTDCDTLAGRVLRTGRPARIDSYTDVGGPGAVLAQGVGMRSGVAAPIIVAGRTWGFLLAMSGDVPLPGGTERRLSQFAELVGTAIGNAESRAELSASRARVVAAADESRRRIQRDLHDGAQQRLVHTIIALKQLKRVLDAAGGPEADLADEALEHAGQAIGTLRELVHGIMPATLTQGGLRAGVHSLVDNIDLPVRVEVLPGRLPAPGDDRVLHRRRGAHERRQALRRGKRAGPRRVP